MTRSAETAWPLVEGQLIGPIDTGRYGSPEMRRLFSDAHRYQLFLTIEVALVRARARLGLVPEESAALISERADIRRIPFERIAQLERETRHEVMAVVSAFAEQFGEAGTTFTAVPPVATLSIPRSRYSFAVRWTSSPGASRTWLADSAASQRATKRRLWSAGHMGSTRCP